ncbi:unnamed protein product [Trichogramma brassicae]|uniref:Uncharacterized protein n=1 Tax=Trichogramma brassicae TaxID=86971 RepID=A0A6H5J570_9HYME|nr:unnamed protein product [Trichogramma brassicae]
MTIRLYEWNGEGAMLTIGELHTPPVAAVTFLPSNEDSSVVLLVFALEGKIVVDGGADGDGVTCIVYEMRNSRDNKNTIVKPLAWLKNMGEIASIYPYRFAGTNYLLIVGDESTSAVYFWDDQRVVDVTVWEHRGIPMIMLIKLDPITGVYNTELWSLHFRQKIPDVTHEDVQQCLDELQVALDKRGAALEESERFMNQIMSGMPLKFDQIFIDSDRVELSSLEFDVEDSESLNPEIILDELLELRAKVDDLLRKASMANEIEDLSGRGLVVEGDAYIDELEIDRLEVESINGVAFDAASILLDELDQTFDRPLEAKNIIIHDLEVPSICGLESSNWLLVDDEEKTDLSGIDWNKASIVGEDTLVVDGDFFVENLNTETINGKNINTLMDDFFIIGKNQIIDGNVTYKTCSRASQVFADEINGVPFDALLTKSDDQFLDDVYIENLDVSHLYVETINGVRVDQAARISQENVIKGRVSLANLEIIEELEVQGNFSMPFARPLQVYDEVHINGDVYVNNFFMKEQSSLIVDGSDLNVQEILENSWTKSTDQTIVNSVVFEEGASIDELSCRFLNGFTEEDFVYTTDTEFDGLENVTFSRFRFNRVFDENNREISDFIDESPMLLTFKKPIRLKHLQVDSMITDSYNGAIKINQVLSVKHPINLHVFGDLTWEEDSSKPQSLSYLFKNAMTKSGNQTFDCPVEFLAPVSVDSLRIPVESPALEMIQGVIEDAVIDSDDDTAAPIVIRGRKRFKKELLVNELTVDGDLNVDRINDVYVDRVFLQIFQKNTGDVMPAVEFSEDIKIGQLISDSRIHNVSLENIATIFENDVEFVKNINVAGHTDGSILNYDIDIDRLFTEDPEFYLEESETINKIHVANAFKFRSSRISESITRLDIYTIEPGNYCGLTDSNCHCRRQHVVDILPSGEYSLRSGPDSDVVFNFYDAKDRFELSVASSAVSTGQDCLRGLDLTELTRVFLTMFYEDPRDRKLVAEIQGFVTDADIFVLDAEIAYTC